MSDLPSSDPQRTSSRPRTKNSRFVQSPERDVASSADVKRKRERTSSPSSFELFSAELKTLAQIAREVADEEVDKRPVAAPSSSGFRLQLSRLSVPTTVTTMLEVCVASQCLSVTAPAPLRSNTVGWLGWIVWAWLIVTRHPPGPRFNLCGRPSSDACVHAASACAVGMRRRHLPTTFGCRCASSPTSHAGARLPRTRTALHPTSRKASPWRSTGRGRRSREGSSSVLVRAALRSAWLCLGWREARSGPMCAESSGLQFAESVELVYGVPAKGVWWRVCSVPIGAGGQFSVELPARSLPLGSRAARAEANRINASGGTLHDDATVRWLTAS